jgi:hypothetical protein
MFLSINVFGQIKSDTVVRKKYLDSLKNQLAAYTLGSYTYLNLYDQAEAEKKELKIKLEKTENTLDYILWRRRRENIQTGAFFVALGGFIITSFILIK